MRDQVFISYSKKADQQFARRLAVILRAASFTPWLDEEQIAVAKDYERLLYAAMGESGHGVFVVSVPWLEGDWTRQELKIFASGGGDRPRVAILRFPRDQQILPPELNHLHNVVWLDGTPDEAACVWQVLCGLTGELPGPSAEWAAKGQAVLARIAAATEPAAPTKEQARTARPKPAPRDRDGVYLSCNRSEQWGELLTILARRKHEMVFLPGPRGEAHDEFMRRIESRLSGDPPRRIVNVTWSDYPCPRQPELLLADLALAMEVDEGQLQEALRGELDRHDLVLLQPVAHCLGSPALRDYLTKLLPAALPAETRFACKIVQPIEWSPRSVGARLAGWFGALAVGARRDGDASDPSAFMDDVKEKAGPGLAVVKLPLLKRIDASHLENFCETHNLPRDRWPGFIKDVLGDARTSRDVLLNVQRFFPTVELT